MSKCRYKEKDGECLYEKRFPYKEYCVEGPCSHDTPMTNADRIRAMTDEELARYHSKKFGCPHDPVLFGCEMKTIGCNDCWLEWLKQECEA